MTPVDLDFLAVAPEVLLAAGALAVLGVDLLWRPQPRWWGIVAAVSLVAAIAASVLQWWEVAEREGAGLFFSGKIALDGYSAFGGIVMFSIAGLGLAAAWPLVLTLQRRGAEFVALVLIAAAGFHVMAASADLILLFLGLETASISLYVIAGFIRDRAAADEAALKYFLLGAFASAVFLYGIALFYAGTGTTSLVDGGDYLRNNILLEPGVLLIGVGLMIVGLGFKVSAVPFHLWAPDVYQGAPGGIVGYMVAAAKIGGFAGLGRVLSIGVGPFVDDWGPAVAVIAALSLVVGTALAIAQTDMKRMLAYSGIAHAGFILTALVAAGDGLPAMWFYVATYSFQVIAAFAVAAVVSGAAGGPSPLSDYAGLSTRSPLLAATLMVAMLAMGGIPLLTGFVGKVGVWQAAIDADYLWLVIVGVLSTVAGLFFYLRVIVLMYLQAPAVAAAPGTVRARPEAGLAVRFAMLVAVAVTVVFGVVPWPLLDVVADALPF